LTIAAPGTYVEEGVVATLEMVADLVVIAKLLTQLLSSYFANNPIITGDIATKIVQAYRKCSTTIIITINCNTKHYLLTERPD
jgi:hypothetical protein